MRLRKTFSIAVVLLAVFVSTLAVAAQGRYVGQLSRNDVDNIIKRLEESGDDFRSDFKKELKRSNLSGAQKNRYEDQVEDFENATDRLRKRFDNGDPWWESRNQVQDVISNSRPLNATMNIIAFRRNIERQWNRLRNDVNKLADTYDLPGINGGGWNGGPWNPGNPGNPGGPGFPGPGTPGDTGGPTTQPPAWAIGRFRSVYPQTTIEIFQNGQVTMVSGGRTSYGRFHMFQVYVDGRRYTLSQNGAMGFRLRERNSGQNIDYTRAGGGDNGGPTSRPPSWLRGSFRTEGFQNVRLTVDRDGRVTMIHNSRTSQGRYYGGQIYLDGDILTVTRDRNGIRTHNRRTGITTNFRKQ